MSIQVSATTLLGSLPFGQIIGGPLKAAVEAQALAAETTAAFIERVAFKDSGDVRNVTFLYQKGEDTIKMVVPLLVIIPIPFIRIDDISIDFLASISAETTTANTTTTGVVKTETTIKKAQASAGFFFGSASGSVDVNASVSSKRDSTSSRESRYNVEYTMSISCHAVQDDIPAGMSAVLSILRTDLQSKTLGKIEIEKGVSFAADGTSIGAIGITALKADGNPLAGEMLEITSDDLVLEFPSSTAFTDTAGKAVFHIRAADLGVTGGTGVFRISDFAVSNDEAVGSGKVFLRGT